MEILFPYIYESYSDYLLSPRLIHTLIRDSNFDACPLNKCPLKVTMSLPVKMLPLSNLVQEWLTPCKSNSCKVPKYNRSTDLSRPSCLSARARCGETQSHPFHVTNRRSLAERPTERERTREGRSERGREAVSRKIRQIVGHGQRGTDAAIIIKLKREIHPERGRWRAGGAKREGERNILESEQRP